MTGIIERCGEKACARLSAKRSSGTCPQWPWRGRIDFPFRVSTPVWEPALGAGSVHGMGVGRGVEVSVAEAVGVGENVGVAKSGAF